MMRRAALLGSLLAIGPAAYSASWEFGAALAVTGEPRAGVFHQLESAGRKNLAVAGDTVALVWTDNRAGVSQVHAAFRTRPDRGFEREWRVSGDAAAFDPTVIALSDGRFLIGWEEADAVWLRVATPTELGPPLRLSAASRQIALAPLGKSEAVAAWAEKAGAHARIVTARIGVSGVAVVSHAAPQPVESDPPQQDQLYPSLAVNGREVVVAWEDRRHGHTRLYYACSADAKAFSAPIALNDVAEVRTVRFGRGSGVTRVALASGGEQKVAATWMDKRDYQSGYGVYAAFMDEKCRFGANEKVQDEFGDQTPQWHPAIAAHPTIGTVIAWDDMRDGTSDIWLSWKEPGGWSEDLAVPVAAGARHQDNPVMAVDAQGNLHLAWLERDQPGGASRVMYAVGQLAK